MQNLITAFKALGDQTRLKLFKLVALEELCVCELEELLNVSQSAVSQHLAKLKAAGLVRERRQGQWVYYKANRQQVDRVLAGMIELLDADLGNVPEMAAEHQRRSGLIRANLCK